MRTNSGYFDKYVKSFRFAQITILWEKEINDQRKAK